MIACLLGLSLVARAHAQNGYASLVTDPAYAPYRYLPLSEVNAGTTPDLAPGSSPATAGRVIGAPPVVPGPLFNLPAGGSAIALDGLTQHIELDIPDFAPQLANAAGVSWVIWYRSIDTTRGALMAIQNTPDRNGFQFILGANISWNAPSPVQVTGVITFPFGDFRASTFATDFADQDWHMFAATYRAGELRLFADGIPIRNFFNNVGGTQRLAPFTAPLILGGVPVGTPPARTIESRKTVELAHASLHRTALSESQILALWYTGNGYTGQTVYNAAALQPWFADAQSRRVDVALIGDSNILYGTPTGPFGHQYGMLQGLRRVLPIYASAVLPGQGFGGWVSQLNGIAPPIAPLSSAAIEPPPFIASQVPPSDDGFVSRPLYVAPGQSITSGPNLFSTLAPSSPDFPLIFSDRLQWHIRTATFAQGPVASAALRPGLRAPGGAVAPLAEAVWPSVTGTDGLITRILEVPAGVRSGDVNWSLQYADLPGDIPAQGPLGVLYSRLVLPDVTRGASLTPLWAVGGESARFAADKFINRCSVPQLGAMLSQIVALQSPGQERLLIHIIEGGNDANDRRPAYDTSGVLTTVRSDILAGQKLNTLGIMTRIRDAWINQGYSPQKLHFLLGPYHPLDTVGPKTRIVYLRGWRELARDLPDWNITVMDGFGLSTVNEFINSSWYDPGGQAHLTQPGYLNFGLRTWRALAQAAGFATVAGACCRGSTCSLTAIDDCTTPGSSFQGLSTICNPAGNRTSPCCAADFDHNNSVGVQDIFSFLNAWFALSPTADVSADGTVGVQDIFDYLDAWFLRC